MATPTSSNWASPVFVSAQASFEAGRNMSNFFIASSRFWSFTDLYGTIRISRIDPRFSSASVGSPPDRRISNGTFVLALAHSSDHFSVSDECVDRSHPPSHFFQSFSQSPLEAFPPPRQCLFDSGTCGEDPPN